MTRINTPSLSGNAYTEIIYLALACILGLLVAHFDLLTVVVAFVVIAVALLSLIRPYIALVFLLTLAPARALIATESPLRLPLDIGQISLIFFISVWMIRRIADHRTMLRLPISPVTTALGVFIIVSALSGLNAISSAHWLTEWLKWLIVLLMVIYVVNSDVPYKWLIFALAVAGIAHAVVGIYTFLGGSGADHLLITGSLYRAFGTFGQPNPFGGFMGLIAPLVLAMAIGHAHIYLYEARRPHQAISGLFYAVACLLIVGALIASWSRGAWLGLTVSFAITLIALPRRIWQNALIFVALTIALASVLVGGLLPTVIAERLTSAVQDLVVIRDVRGVFITADNYAVIERLAHWQAAIGMATDHPWLGVGLGNYGVVYQNYNLLNWELSLQHAHNYYLNVLGEAGIIGLVGYLALFTTIFASSWYARTHPDTLSRYIVIGLIGTWTYLSIHSLLDNLYVNNVFIHVGVMLGLLVRLHRDVTGKTGFKVTQ